jgi:hypothetical protein
MAPRDPHDRIPEARLEPKGFAEHVERAGANAKHKARRATRRVRQVLAIAVGSGVVLATLMVGSSWQRSRRDAERERMELRMREVEEMRRRDQERAKSDHAKELERRAEEIQRRIEAGEDPLDTIDPETRRKYLPETLP